MESSSSTGLFAVVGIVSHWHRQKSGELGGSTYCASRSEDVGESIWDIGEDQPREIGVVG